MVPRNSGTIVGSCIPRSNGGVLLRSIGTYPELAYFSTHEHNTCSYSCSPLVPLIRSWYYEPWDG